MECLDRLTKHLSQGSKETRKSSGPIDAYHAGPVAKVPAPGKTIPASPTNDMSSPVTIYTGLEIDDMISTDSMIPTNSWPMVIGVGMVRCAHEFHS